MTSKQYDELVGRDNAGGYCDICETRLVVSMERERGRCNDCVDRERSSRKNKNR